MITIITNQQEILNKILSEELNDFFGVIRDNLIDFLDYDNAKQFLKPVMTKERWAKHQVPLTRKAIYERIESYLPFAWKKANDCRRLSANRSIDHMRSYLWLLNDGSLERMESIEYNHYGKEQLIFVSELVGFDWKDADNGERVNS